MTDWKIGDQAAFTVAKVEKQHLGIGVGVAVSGGSELICWLPLDLASRVPWAMDRLSAEAQAVLDAAVRWVRKMEAGGFCGREREELERSAQQFVVTLTPPDPAGELIALMLQYADPGCDLPKRPAVLRAIEAFEKSRKT